MPSAHIARDKWLPCDQLSTRWEVGLLGLGAAISQGRTFKSEFAAEKGVGQGMQIIGGG